MANNHYLDNAATTKIDPEVIETLIKYSSEIYGNPSSLHSMGVSASKALSLSRKLVAEVIGADENQIFFTSGATEANNLIIHSGIENSNSDIPVSTEIEHPSVLESIKNRVGEKYFLLKTDKDGKVEFSEEDLSIISKAPILSIIHTNNEIGTIQDLKKIKSVLNSVNFRGIFHIDATQSVGKINLNVKTLEIDALSASAHKFHGPKGVGFLYVKNPNVLKTLNFGGNQERGYRSGTENIPGICAMAKALSISYSNLQDNYNMVQNKKQKIIDYIENKASDIELTISKETHQSPYILSLKYRSLPSEVLLHMYEKRGIMLSSGSACSSNKNRTSHVLKAIGLRDEKQTAVLRISFSRLTTDDDISAFLDATDSILEEIRR